MKTKVIELTNGFNWGKFMLACFDSEWRLRSALPEAVPGVPLPAALGWTHQHLWVLDLQTGEGAMFRPHGLASADLNKHAIWVCPMYEPFLVWLYKQDLSDLDALPSLVTLTEKDAPSALHGYRRGRRLATGRRTRVDVARERAAILDYFAQRSSPCRPHPSMRFADLAHLVAEGRLEKEVRRDPYDGELGLAYVRRSYYRLARDSAPASTHKEPS